MVTPCMTVFAPHEKATLQFMFEREFAADGNSVKAEEACANLRHSTLI